MQSKSSTPHPKVIQAQSKVWSQYTEHPSERLHGPRPQPLLARGLCATLLTCLGFASTAAAAPDSISEPWPEPPSFSVQEPSSPALPQGQKALFGVEGLQALGLGIGGVNFYAYRGATSRKTLFLPFPYVRYEGPVIKADRDGLRGHFFRDDRLDLSLSASFSPPVSSSVPERTGMPGLKPTLELGPQLDVVLWKGVAGKGKLRLRVPVRQAFTVQGAVQDKGWIFAPTLNLDVPVAAWMWGAVLGPIWANQKQHAHFYDVAAAYATTERPAYRASGGYSGTSFTASLGRKTPGMWWTVYARYDDLHGAAFVQSPLVKQRGDWLVGFAWAWVYE